MQDKLWVHVKPKSLASEEKHDDEGHDPFELEEVTLNENAIFFFLNAVQKNYRGVSVGLNLHDIVTDSDNLEF